MVISSDSMAEAFEQGWSLIKKIPDRVNSRDLARALGEDDEYYQELSIRGKMRQGIPLDDKERPEAVGMPHGHNWQAQNRRWSGQFGSDIPQCSFCDRTVYHTPLKSTSQNEYRFCNNDDCVDKIYELIGSQGHDYAEEMTSDHDKGHGWPVGEDQYETGHIGHQEFDVY